MLTVCLFRFPFSFFSFSSFSDRRLTSIRRNSSTNTHPWLRLPMTTLPASIDAAAAATGVTGDSVPPTSVNSIPSPAHTNTPAHSTPTPAPAFVPSIHGLGSPASSTNMTTFMSAAAIPLQPMGNGQVTIYRYPPGQPRSNISLALLGDLARLSLRLLSRM
jgi:hypothetical protein